jgi:hypothetical protein
MIYETMMDDDLYYILQRFILCSAGVLRALLWKQAFPYRMRNEKVFKENRG